MYVGISAAPGVPNDLNFVTVLLLLGKKHLLAKGS